MHPNIDHKITRRTDWDLEIGADEFRDLPPGQKWYKTPGVYGIKDENGFLYIGQSVNGVGGRLMAHLQQMFFLRGGDLSKFTFCLKACDYPLLEEMKYIYFWRPRYNTEVLKSYGLDEVSSFDLHGGIDSSISEADQNAINKIIMSL